MERYPEAMDWCVHGRARFTLHVECFRRPGKRQGLICGLRVMKANEATSQTITNQIEIALMGVDSEVPGAFTFDPTKLV